MTTRVPRTRNAAVAATCVCALFFVFRPTLAQPVAPGASDEDNRAHPTGRDYDPRNSEWNGLSECYRVMLAAGRTVTFDEAVDLETLPLDEGLVLLHPTAPLPAEALVQWVEAGGRLVIADDFGSGDPLMRALGVRPHPGANPHGTFYRDNPGLPLFSRVAEHPATDGVSVVWGNHALAMRSEETPLVAWDQAAYGLLYEVVPERFSDGEGDGGAAARANGGRALVLGDPSIFINFMLELPDNRTLVRNVIGRLCEGREPCRLHVVTGQTPVVGDYVRPPDDGAQGIREVFDRSFEAVNQRLDLSNLTPSPRGVYVASLLLGLGIAAFLFSALPLSAPKWLSFSLRGRAGVRSRSEFEWNLERLLNEGSDGDYALPLAIVKGEFEELFLGALARNPGELAREQRYQDDQMKRFASRFGAKAYPEGTAGQRKDATERALTILRLLATIPDLSSLVPEVDARYSERLFRRVFGATRRLLAELGLFTEYEQRTGRP